MAGLTISNQELLVLILDKKLVSYRTQGIYNSRKFYNVVSFLRRNSLINPICVVCKRGIEENHRNTCGRRKCEREKQSNCREFELTLKGEIMAHAIKDLKD